MNDVMCIYSTAINDKTVVYCLTVIYMWFLFFVYSEPSRLSLCFANYLWVVSRPICTVIMCTVRRYVFEEGATSSGKSRLSLQSVGCLIF